jgi:hypothetical protein
MLNCGPPRMFELGEIHKAPGTPSSLQRTNSPNITPLGTHHGQPQPSDPDQVTTTYHTPSPFITRLNQMRMLTETGDISPRHESLLEQYAHGAIPSMTLLPEEDSPMQGYQHGGPDVRSPEHVLDMTSAPSTPRTPSPYLDVPDSHLDNSDLDKILGLAPYANGGRTPENHSSILNKDVVDAFFDMNGYLNKDDHAHRSAAEQLVSLYRIAQDQILQNRSDAALWVHQNIDGWKNKSAYYPSIRSTAR